MTAETQSTSFSRPDRRHLRFSIETVIFVLLFLGFCSIFTGYRFDVPIITLTPFDLACMVTAPVLLGAALLKSKVPFSPGFALFTAFILFSGSLGFVLSFENGVREIVQSIQLLLFAGVVTLYRSRLEWSRLARWFLIIGFGIMIYNIWWHLSNGFLVGWKRLDEPKLLFTYLVPVLFALLVLRRREARLLDYALCTAIIVLLILSGERKAQLALILQLAILTMAGYFRWSVVTAAAVLALPLFGYLISTDAYLQQQFSSIIGLTGSLDLGLAEVTSEHANLTQSNAQRLFSRIISEELILQNPVMGIGTNAYVYYVETHYEWLPRYMLLGIHNEFQRVLVENGLIGLILYLLPWLRTASFIWACATSGHRKQAITTSLFFVALFVQCFLESSGTEAFLALLFVALLPELMMSGFAAGRSQESNRGAVP